MCVCINSYTGSIAQLPIVTVNIHLLIHFKHFKTLIFFILFTFLVKSGQKEKQYEQLSTCLKPVCHAVF